VGGRKVQKSNVTKKNNWHQDYGSYKARKRLTGKLIQALKIKRKGGQCATSISAKPKNRRKKENQNQNEKELKEYVGFGERTSSEE